MVDLLVYFTVPYDLLYISFWYATDISIPNFINTLNNLIQVHIRKYRVCICY